MANFRISGIIIRRQALGEADRLLVLATQGKGKQRLVAKGARRPTSKLAPAVELYYHIRGQAAEGKNLDLLTEAVVLERFSKLRNSLRQTALAHLLVERISSLMAEELANMGLYKLLLNCLRFLELTVHPPLLLPEAVTLKVLALGGLRVELQRCAECGQATEPLRTNFSPEKGGIVCQRHQHGWPISADNVKRLRLLGQLPFGQLNRIQRLPKVDQQILTRAVDEIFHYQTDHTTKADKFYRQVTGEPD